MSQSSEIVVCMSRIRVRTCGSVRGMRHKPHPTRYHIVVTLQLYLHPQYHDTIVKLR